MIHGGLLKSCTPAATYHVRRTYFITTDGGLLEDRRADNRGRAWPDIGKAPCRIVYLYLSVLRNIGTERLTLPRYLKVPTVHHSQTRMTECTRKRGLLRDSSTRRLVGMWWYVICCRMKLRLWL